jgi:glycosyltransferase involved in cell wall biosynthesis
MECQITILCAAYRSSEFIERTLASLQAQTFQSFICLITDDCSDDQTVALIQKRVGEDRRFILKQNPQNIGWTANVNQLLDQVSTPYFMIMPHDDFIAPSYLMRLWQSLEVHPEIIAAYSDLIYEEKGAHQRCHFQDTLNESNSLKRAFRSGPWWVPYRAVYRNVKETDIRMKRHLTGEYSADYPWLLLMNLRGRMICIPEPLYHKFIQPQSLSQTWNYSLLNHYAVTLSCFPMVWNSPISLAIKVMAIGVLTLKMPIHTLRKLAELINGQLFSHRRTTP